MWVLCSDAVGEVLSGTRGDLRGITWVKCCVGPGVLYGAHTNVWVKCDRALQFCAAALQHHNNVAMWEVGPVVLCGGYVESRVACDQQLCVVVEWAEVCSGTSEGSGLRLDLGPAVMCGGKTG